MHKSGAQWMGSFSNFKDILNLSSNSELLITLFFNRDASFVSSEMV